MTSLRKLAVSFTALGCVGLLGCSSGGDTPVAPALPPASASTSPSSSAAVPPVPSGDTSAPAPAPNATPAPGAATVPPAPGAPGAPANPTAAPKPPVAAPNPANPANPGATPPAALGDPAQAVAAAGPKAQPYLKSLQDRGIISNPALDGIYILFGQAVCSAKAKGETRESILNEFAQIGPMLAPGSSLSPAQVSEVFVSAAEQVLC